jgi:hypothetical protein
MFDWTAFHQQFSSVLMDSLLKNDPKALIEYGNKNLALLRDPYEGQPLGQDWTDRLETGDVQEVGDFVLTKFYDPADDMGLGTDWRYEEELAEDGRAALLGQAFGPPDQLFDPGRMGSYFQDLETTRNSQQVFSALAHPKMKDFESLLCRAVQLNRGVYVTF